MECLDHDPSHHLFFPSECNTSLIKENTAGAVVTSAGQKQKLAKESMAWNLQNEEFINLFPLE